MRVLDPRDPEHRRAAERLSGDIVAWLTTVAPGGQPQSTPVWFLWEDEAILVYSQTGKPKLANIAANPQVNFHLRGTEGGDDVVIVEGAAEIPEGQAPADQVPGYIDKYRDRIREYGWTPESFAEDYSVPLRISPTRLRIW